MIHFSSLPKTRLSLAVFHVSSLELDRHIWEFHDGAEGLGPSLVFLIVMADLDLATTRNGGAFWAFWALLDWWIGGLA